jgi:AcrR family transcriptional regulator
MIGVARSSHTLLQTDGCRSKRAPILNAAIDNFGEDGYEHTVWATIADQVGIGRSTLYYYFESKAHCLLTIMSIELNRSLQAFREVTAGVARDQALVAAISAAYDVSPREVLQKRIVHSHMDLLAAPRSSAVEEAERQRARNLVRDIENEWTALLARGITVVDSEHRAPRAMANVVLAMVVSVWRWYRPGGPMTLEQVRDLITGACLRVIAA